VLLVSIHLHVDTPDHGMEVGSEGLLKERVRQDTHNARQATLYRGGAMVDDDGGI
jgi:hypothetical protein